MRLCPVCRMPISILAVRCRFCGAEVGRPRKEQETFTVKDLGGEQKSSYTVSGDVTEALDAFISEERAQLETKERQRQEAAKKSFFRRKKAAEEVAPAVKSPTDLPDLDESSQELASVVTSSTSQSKLHLKKQPIIVEIIGRKTLVIAALIAGLILLYFGTDFAWARIRHIINPQTAQDDFVYPNRANDFYAAGAPLTEVLEEAVTALRHNDTEENREIAEIMRRRLIEDITDKAFATPFNMSKLNQASGEITRAAAIDTDARVRQLMDEVTRETAYLKFILSRVDIDTETAHFRLNNPFVDEREQEVSVGDLLQNRFLVKSITPREVLLEDTSPRGAGRQFIARRLEPVEAYL